MDSEADDEMRDSSSGELMDVDDMDDDKTADAAAPVPPRSPTQEKPILPTPLATAVSLGTGAARRTVRAARFIGGFPFHAAKFTALTSIELSRHGVETIFKLAGRDVYTQNQTDGGRAGTVSAVNQALNMSHQAFVYLQIFTAMGFETTGIGLSTVVDSFEFGLSLLDGFLGSTESSRALRSIGKFLSQQFNNPATGQQEAVGTFDLFYAFCGLVYLQQSCRQRDEKENERLGVEEIIWDFIVLQGQRADVPEEREEAAPSALQEALAGNGEDLSPLEARLRQQLANLIPPQAKVVISSSTLRTVTVDISGSPPPHLDAPRGMELVEVVELGATQSPSSLEFPVSAKEPSAPNPTYRFVFRTTKDAEAVFDNPTKSQEKVDRGVQASETEYVPQTVPPAQEGPFEDHPPEDVPPPVPPKSPTMLKTRRTSSSQTMLPIYRTSPRQESPFRSNLVKPSGNQSPSRANQKKPRVRPSATSPRLPGPNLEQQGSSEKVPTKVAKSINMETAKQPEKKGGLRSAIKKGFMQHREDSNAQLSAGKEKPPPQALPQRLAVPKMPVKKPTPSPSQLPVPGRLSSLKPRRQPSLSLTPLTAQALESHNPSDPLRSETPSSQSVNDRDSVISFGDNVSVFTYDSGRTIRAPSSPTSSRKSGTFSTKMRSEVELSIVDSSDTSPDDSRPRSRAYAPSIYTLKTTESQTSLLPLQARSTYFNAEGMNILRRTGVVGAMFPKATLHHNIARYMRFSSAAYGRGFLNAMGIAKYIPPITETTNAELLSFAHHTGILPEDILVASFIDTQGGADSTGSTNTGVPLVHYIALDHGARAVVFACRGTLGFEDILADMACDYDDLVLRGNRYRVHKGIHASACRLLYGRDGRVLASLRDALEKYPEYGLVLCGHSLGGAVTSLLGAMLSERQNDGTFVTSATDHQKLLGDGGFAGADDASAAPSLPNGRPIHVFAYGPPGTMSATLARRTKGLITTVVQGNDIVPYLSIGVLHDFQSVAAAFRKENGPPITAFWQSLGTALHNSFKRNWWTVVQTPQDEDWAYAWLKTLRSQMSSPKLLPPGEVLVLQGLPVLMRDASLAGQPTTVQGGRRVVLSYVRDVETRFREIRFGLNVLTDHNPSRYEDALNMLRLGTTES